MQIDGTHRQPHTCASIPNIVYTRAHIDDAKMNRFFHLLSQSFPSSIISSTPIWPIQSAFIHFSSVFVSVELRIRVYIPYMYCHCRLYFHLQNSDMPISFALAPFILSRHTNLVRNRLHHILSTVVFAC